MVLGALARGESVLVHCRAGKHRSGAMSVVILCLLWGVEFWDAFTRYLEIRRYLGPYIHIPWQYMTPTA